jgi:prepilin-type processing-associated H-X9-DG protein
MSESRWPSYLMGLGVLALLVSLFFPPSLGHPPHVYYNQNSKNNLKQIALALHNYRAENGAFPAQAIYSADRKPLLSWRVAILPYMEAGIVAIGLNQFHLDEPWDSEHNRALIAKMPDVFRFPGQANTGETRYLGVVGPGTVFGQDHGATTHELTDGLSNTIMVVEADYGIPWTQPEDLDYDPTHPMLGFGQAHKGGFNALFADGGVRFLLESMDKEILRGLMTINGGEQVTVP